MTENKPGLLFPTIEFMVLAAIMIAVPVIVGLDVDVFLYGSSEVSATELTQEALILLSAIVSGITAIRHPASRSWLVLVSGFFACMFLREIDFWLDRVSHGFWVYPTAITGLAAISYSARNRDGFLDAAADYLATRSHAYIAVGLLIVVLFSRLAGTRGLKPAQRVQIKRFFTDPASLLSLNGDSEKWFFDAEAGTVLYVT